MKIIKFFELFITLIMLFSVKSYFVKCNNDEEKKNDSIYLSKCDKSYNFLETKLKNSDSLDNLSYEDVQKQIFDIDLNTLHVSLLNNLRINNLRNIIDIKTSIFNCIINTFRQMAKALPAVLEEVFTYNPFCKSIEEVFSFLYEIDERYEHLIKNCAETTQSRILYTYFNTYIQDIEDVIDIYRDDPSIIFSKFEFVIICLNEFYRKITGNFYPYVKDTALFTKYMDNHEYKKNNSKTDDIKYIEEFIKYIRENVDKIDVIEFIQELYDLYSINNFYISCFYVF
ncbi:conserved Plasmodium protein, unknown function [Plasmodium chabaudi chabaudi]|uniref:Plasmodium RESA N-terminal domain-containing protein n=1 Tax=Plasmodium chabaudi chabaudi TaxID=31271 RepID=A0A077TM92_PLACU|nr:conserved Plasmodium protein, unknown function [Plasmodium chabaudi chabaudi]SCL98501.1 conserved Plasmodium protein, unknown function [Plasmodium chabaudi chabaudi]SCL99319.1 conserved Plasmodium protein, unknown function [Plasmodium chabaudi chabaudi]VTZ67273.1 conserved Plasmodium protein, unknown function [Plasmodium chabaudi chabaudi]|eukprot:XP_016653320.1 conserved Plasmodium protein, unknown function [Plasmodium chabaudi chabaudi]